MQAPGDARGADSIRWAAGALLNQNLNVPPIVNVRGGP